MSQVSSTRKLVSASAIMASGTMISRVLGLLRVMLLAFIFGSTSRQVDMFTLATTVPNSLYILFAGGALNTVLVPQIVRAIKNDDDGGEAYTNRIMTAFMLIVGAVAVMVTIATPLVTQIYSSSGWRSAELSEQYASMVALTYLTLPQIFFYGAFFLLGQVLNARDKFGPMMWAPIANNVVSILVLSTYLIVWGNQEDHSQAFTTPQILLLGLGSTLGIAVQMAVLLPFIKKVGFKLRPRFDLKGTGLGKTFSLTKWTIGFVAVNQLALVVVNRLATSATATGQGAGVMVYNEAYLIWILPHSLITVSLATAMLPNASRLAAAGNTAGVADEFTKTVRLALIAIVPATVGFVALATPIANLLFGHGQGSDNSIWVGWALLAFAVGLIPFTVQFVCLRTFYALENTRTPFFLQCLIAAINIVGAIALVWLVSNPNLVAAALGLAYALSYAVGVFLSWQALRKRIPQLDGRELGMHLVRLLLGTAVGGVIAHFVGRWVTDAVGGVLGDLIAIFGGLLIIGGLYLVVSKLLKVRELASLSTLVRTRFGRRTAKGVDAGGAADIARSEAEAGSSVQQMVDDNAPTRISPAIDDLTATRVAPAIDEDAEDSGPATVVRNRAPVTEHSFDQSFRRPDAGDDDPFPAPLDEDEPSDDESSAQWDVESSPAAEEEDEDTGPIDMEGLFREESVGRVASVGTLLNTRYELVQSLADRHGTETWRAHDQVLSRDVVVHVVAPGDPRISELMMAARKGAAATDSRFLRVLDADEMTDPTQGIGAYVVAEYAAGRSLTDLLATGPLSGIEAAYIVRELADAMVPVHSQGLFHEHLNPDNVIITNTGAVRIVGFGIEAALAGRDEDGHAWSAREHADLIGLGSLLYATLVAHWPGRARWGLPAAPIIAGETAAPHTVMAGVSPALDRICAATLTSRGSISDRRITTASEMVDALSAVIGTADASSDLETRVRRWHAANPQPQEPVAPSLQRRHAEDELDSTGPLSALFADDDAPRRADDDDTETKLVPASGRDMPRSRQALVLLIALALLALIISLFALGRNDAADNANPTSSVSGSVDPAVSESPAEGPAPAIISVEDFDPEADGGNGEENPDTVDNVFDGDPATTWQTLRYHNRPDMGGLKPGVGLVLDLGEARTVTAAELVLVGGPTAVELRMPAGEDPSMRTEEDWTVIASDDAAAGTATLTPSAPEETRYLLVYFTNLPQIEDQRFRAEVGEITLR